MRAPLSPRGLPGRPFGPAMKPSNDMPTSKNTLPTSAFDPVDLAPAVFYELVIPLHEILKLLHVLAVLPAAALPHPLERVHARHFHLGNERPVPLGTEVGHHAHLRHADLGAELGHGQKLLYHRAHLTRLTVHDLANEEHVALPCWGGLFDSSRPPLLP